jgi:hypothetical protein
VIFLVLVCVATAVLLVWLAFELGRLALGEHGDARSVPALHHGVIGAVRVPTAPAPADSLSEALKEPPPPRGGPGEPAGWAEQWEVDQAVERMVRERLYGNGHSSARRVDAA